MSQETKSNRSCSSCDVPGQVVRIQWEDDCGGPTIYRDDHICLECGLYVDSGGCSLCKESLKTYRKEYGHLVSRKGCVDQSLIRTRSVRKISDGVVRYNCDQKAKTMLFDKMLAWFMKHETFEGECIMQTDAPLIDAPDLLCEIAEDIFDFDIIWVEKE